MSDDEMEDYGFEYSDEDEPEEDVDIENQYYNSKGLMEGEDKKDALKGFEEVVKMEDGKGEWGFKALKQMVKLQYTLQDYPGMLKTYREMLTYIKDAVTRNQSEKKINSLVDYISQSTDMNLLQDFYADTLKALEEAKNERLWFKTQLKLCGLWFELKEYGRAQKLLKSLHQSCQKDDGSDDMRKGTQLLEVYALEIQIYTELKDNKALKALYKKALEVKSAIPHPKIMGIIRECGGKMHMMERIWVEAATDFFEAFKSYDEAGAHRRVQCLKYLVLAYMLMESSVDPFDAQEAKPYKNDLEVTAMTDLVQAYQRNDINSFEKILKANRKSIYGDPFIRQYIDDLLKNIRTQVVLERIKPYTHIRIPHISKELRIPADEVEQLLASLILDNRIEGSIDQVDQVLELSPKSEDEKYTSMQKWSASLIEMHSNIVTRLAA